MKATIIILSVVILGIIIWLIYTNRQKSVIQSSPKIIPAPTTVITPAPSSTIPDWDATKYYNVGDLVKYNGLIYKCIVATTSGTVGVPPTNTSIWTLQP